MQLCYRCIVRNHDPAVSLTSYIFSKTTAHFESCVRGSALNTRARDLGGGTSAFTTEDKDFQLTDVRLAATSLSGTFRHLGLPMYRLQTTSSMTNG